MTNRLLSSGLLCLVAVLSASSSLSVAPAPVRALLISGGCCHDYTSQKNLIAKGLHERAHIEVTTVQQGGETTNTKIAVYENPDWAKGYDLIIHDECFSDVKDPSWTARILKPHQDGLPAVVLHCAMHSYRDGTEEWFKFLGVTSWGHGAHYPHEVLTRDASHPIMRGMGPGWWNPAGELYNITKFWPTAHGLGSTKNQENGVEEICVWVNQYNGHTPVFGTTLGHHNETVSSDWYLDLLTRGTLWAAGKLNDAYLKPEQPRLLPVNLTKGAKATASSEQQGHPPRDAVDGNAGSRWCANGAQTNEWLQVDLGRSEKISTLQIDWENPGAIYHYKVEASTDGSQWSLLVDGSSNSRPGATQDIFSPRDLRYVKVQFLGSGPGQWGSIHELALFGDQTIPAESADLVRIKEQALLAELKFPDAFEASLFASPPAVNYPVFVAAAPDGTLFVSSDKNGSIDRGPWRGRVLRVRDLDNDGRADEVKMFVPNVDSPRGLVWDRDRLYLLHPPHLSAFIDKDGDGISDEQKILVRNIAFTFKDRPADHTSNGIELGIDGWIYCAIGDFGFMEAEGTDGRKLQLRAGGVVRVRPDGSGLELYSRGTRNILEAALSPTLEAFARDNTNDGDGWDIRLHHFTGLSEHGYPSLYKNFHGEFIEPLADYGGGSGCGAMFLNEPGFPSGYNNAVYTADWGREWIYRHTLIPNGATFKADQHEFVRAPRVTDLDVDASSRIYLSSWKGATFTYTGEEVGSIIRLTPKGYQAPALPDLKSLPTAELISILDSPSHRRRLAAQRELLFLPLDQNAFTAIQQIAADSHASLETRVAAIFLLKQKWGPLSHPFLAQLAGDPVVAEFAIRALADHTGQMEGIHDQVLVTALQSSSPRVRREAAFAVARLGHPALAQPLSTLLGDSDKTVAHTAIQASKKLQAAEAMFAILDQSDAPSHQRSGALQVLQALHQPAVVSGLIKRLSTETDSNQRVGLFTALARLHFTDGPWKGDSWGTRPDTSGPYYQPAEWAESGRIAQALHQHVSIASAGELPALVKELARHKVQTQQILETLVTLASKNPSLLPATIEQLSRSENIPASAHSLLIDAANQDPLRSQAIIALAQINSPDAAEAMLTAMASLDLGARETQPARQAVRRWRFAVAQQAVLHKATQNQGPRADWAYGLLLNLTSRDDASPEAKSAAQSTLDAAWQTPSGQAQILRAAGLVEHRASKDKILASARSSDPALKAAAFQAAKALRLEKDLNDAITKPLEKTIADLKIEEVIAAVVALSGDAKKGAELFNAQSCANCHTTNPIEPLRGPFLGNIAATYKRPELTEAILLPNKSLGQGFITHQFLLKDGEEIEGFVIQEAADQVTIRNVAAQEIIIPVTDIRSRKKIEKSLMPDGLVNNLTVQDLASMVDFLQSLAK